MSGSVHFLCVCGRPLPVAEGASISCTSCGHVWSRRAIDHNDTSSLLLDEAELIALQDAPSERAAAERPALEPGLVLGHYELLGQIGEGGMGRVFKARDTSLQRIVAVKVLVAPKGRRSQPHIDRLFHEARSQARINHQNVTHIYYVGIDHGYPFFAMELVDGVSLFDVLQDGPLPFHAVVDSAIQVARAMRHAARFDIVHGDVKPANMLVNSDGLVKLSDFGLARRISDTHQNVGIAGTPNYFPPELESSHSPGIWGDQYMLGVSLFELTFGRLPYSFGESSPREKLSVHQTADIRWPRPWPAEVPHRWRRVLARLMAKDPVDRYLNHSDLLQDLLGFQRVLVKPANWFVRGVAWSFDLALATAFFVLSMLAIRKGQEMLAASDLAMPSWALAGSFFLVPLVVCLTQIQWGNTLGKFLFQLRIGDRHGLPVSRGKMALRSLFQFGLLWVVALEFAWRLFQPPPLWLMYVPLGLLVLDALCAILHRNHRTLHDMLLGSQVVYNLQKDPR